MTVTLREGGSQVPRHTCSLSRSAAPPNRVSPRGSPKPSCGAPFMDGCLSGRKEPPAKRLAVQAARGFDSHPVRSELKPSDKRGLPTAPVQNGDKRSRRVYPSRPGPTVARATGPFLSPVVLP